MAWEGSWRRRRRDPQEPAGLVSRVLQESQVDAPGGAGLDASADRLADEIADAIEDERETSSNHKPCDLGVLIDPAELMELRARALRADALERQHEATMRVLDAGRHREEQFAALQERYEALEALTLAERQRGDELRQKLEQALQARALVESELNSQRNALEAESLRLASVATSLHESQQVLAQDRSALLAEQDTAQQRFEDLQREAELTRDAESLRSAEQLVIELRDKQLDAARSILQERAALNEDRKSLRRREASVKALSQELNGQRSLLRDALTRAAAEQRSLLSQRRDLRLRLESPEASPKPTALSETSRQLSELSRGLERLDRQSEDSQRALDRNLDRIATRIVDSQDSWQKASAGLLEKLEQGFTKLSAELMPRPAEPLARSLPPRHARSSFTPPPPPPEPRIEPLRKAANGIQEAPPSGSEAATPATTVSPTPAAAPAPSAPAPSEADDPFTAALAASSREIRAGIKSRRR
jgi:hypothetical protein